MPGSFQAPPSSTVIQAIKHLVEAIPNLENQQYEGDSKNFIIEVGSVHVYSLEAPTFGTSFNEYRTNAQLDAKRHQLREAEANILANHENAIFRHQELDSLADKGTSLGSY